MLYVAPVSREAVKAAVSAEVAGLCCSVSQVSEDPYSCVDYDWLQAHVPRDFQIERDHLGKVESHAEVMEYLELDRKRGFNAVMLHTHNITPEWTEAYQLACDLGYTIQLGPGEDDSKPIDLDLWRAYPSPWVSYPNGSLIRPLSNQQDPLQIQAVPGLHRAHNSDWHTDMNLIKQNFAGWNVAPQLGSVQSAFYLAVSMSDPGRYPIDDWVKSVQADVKNLDRWCKGGCHSPMLMIGHYSFRSIPWRGSVEHDCVAYLTRVLRSWK